MAKRENPYEAAFAAYLRHHRIPYVATQESHRQHAHAAAGCSLGQAGAVKNLDYLVSPASGCTWLVDVKGRRFPAGRSKQYWKNWTSREDLRGLENWERLFGAGSGGLLVFAYMILGDRSPLPIDELFFHNQQWYAFLAIRWFDYASAAKTISPKWDTVAMPTKRFRELALPAKHFFQTCKSSSGCSS
jgi:hypothetical protein